MRSRLKNTYNSVKIQRISSDNYQGSSSSLMAGFAFALAVDANEIQVEMLNVIELCYSPSGYREYHLTTIYQSSSSSHMAGFAFALALDANEIQVEKHIELCFSLSRYREYHLTTLSKQFIFTYGWFCICVRP